MDHLKELRKFSHVFDAAHNGIVIVDAQGIVVIYNRAAGKLLEVEPHRAVGRHIKEVAPEAWYELKSILQNKRPQVGKKISIRNKTIITNRSPILTNAQVIGVISVLQDISEYEKIMTEMESYKQLNQELDAIIKFSYDGLYITDGKANTLRVNPAYERISGLKAEELIGRNMHELVREGYFNQSVTLEVLKTKQPVTIMQEIVGGKKVMVTGNPVFDKETGEITLVVTNVRDITELDRLRRELEDHKELSEKYFSELQELRSKLVKEESEFIARSKAMRDILKMAIKVASVDTSILISGEPGVGKGMLAKLIHDASPRHEKSFIKVNCAAIPENLLESELFGYERGAFTGASPNGKPGLFEVADGGTIFLDEIGELPLQLQAKLLGILEDRQLTRIGGTRPKKVDVRVIAASNNDLKQLVNEGKFREDLFFRLEVIPIKIPPLRERREDIFPLIQHFLKKYNEKFGTQKRLSADAIDALLSYDYPGNVRELQNIVERLVVTSEKDLITSEDLPSFISLSHSGMIAPGINLHNLNLKEAIKRVEAFMIKEALRRGGSTYAAARLLGVHQSTVVRKAQKYGIDEKMH